MSQLWIDRRYTGHHGISRYASEVLGRLTTTGITLPVESSPTSPRGMIDSGWSVPQGDDLIYSPGFGTGRSTARQLLTIHDLIHLRGKGMKAAAQRLYYEKAVKPAIQKCGHVLTVSRTSADALADWLDDDTVQIHNLGNGCSDSFTTEGPTRQSDPPYLLYVGNSKPHKNAEVLFRALRLLDEFELIVVSSDRAEFTRFALENGVIDRVTVLSGVDDERLASYYRGAIALLFPSLIEGFGLPALESIRCGTPVIFFAGCESVAEIVGDCGLAVQDHSSATEFAASIRVANNISWSRDRSWPQFDWSKVAAGVDSVLTQVK